MSTTGQDRRPFIPATQTDKKRISISDQTGKITERRAEEVKKWIYSNDVCWQNTRPLKMLSESTKWSDNIGQFLLLESVQGKVDRITPSRQTWQPTDSVVKSFNWSISTHDAWDDWRQYFSLFIKKKNEMKTPLIAFLQYLFAVHNGAVHTKWLSYIIGRQRSPYSVCQLNVTNLNESRTCSSADCTVQLCGSSSQHPSFILQLSFTCLTYLCEIEVT